MACSCPDWGVPCKHLAATFYLLAEAFDADPFQILHWRGRDRETLLANLRALRGDAPASQATPGQRDRGAAASGTAPVLSDVVSPELAETVGRFWVAPVPLPPRPPTLITDVDLMLRQLPGPRRRRWAAPTLTDAAARALRRVRRPLTRRTGSSRDLSADGSARTHARDLTPGVSADAAERVAPPSRTRSGR